METFQMEKNKYNKIEKELIEMKLLTEKYKEKNRLLLAYIMSSENETVYEKKENDSSLIFNNNKKNKIYGDILNVIDKESDNKNIFKNIEDYGRVNTNKNVNTINSNATKYDNLNKNFNGNLNIGMFRDEINLNCSESESTGYFGDSFSFKNNI